MNSITGNRIIPTFLEFHASSHPHATAVIAETNAGVRQWLTWSELDALANQAGNWILAQGLCRGGSIVIHLPNSLEFFVLWLAAAKTGTVAVPADPSSTVAELRYIVEHSEARLAVAECRTAEVARAACGGCPQMARVVVTNLAEPIHACDLGREIKAQSAAKPNVTIGPLDVAGMLYTSGTTGKPKGVMLTHAAYLYGAEVFARATGLRPTDRHLIALPLHHAAAQCHAMTPSLVAGASTVIVERFSASRFLEQAVRYHATRAALFGAPLRMLLRHWAGSPVHRTSLALVTFAQNLTPEELQQWETNFHIPLMQLWGMTETVGLPLMVPLNGQRDNMCLGLPVAGYDVKIVAQNRREVADGTPGEIVVRAEPGWNVTSGYFKNPQATSELIRDGWLQSGDRAVRDERGQFHFRGRFKELIKRAGENVSPLEVEDVLKGHPAVLDAGVVGVPDPTVDERVVAFVAFREGQSATPNELQQWCLNSLSAFKVPEEFSVCTEFPRTSVGKIQRHLLRRSWLEAHPDGV
jgi:crotonobetaine/carnitine-CoA ligase